MSRRSCSSQTGTLLGGGLGSLGRELRIRMHVVQRQMAPHVADVAEVAEQLADDGLGLATVRALEIAVLDEGDRCRFAGAADVVAGRVDRAAEVDDHLVRSPAARGS